jgi:hypothetical protein
VQLKQGRKVLAKIEVEISLSRPIVAASHVEVVTDDILVIDEIIIPEQKVNETSPPRKNSLKDQPAATKDTLKPSKETLKPPKADSPSTKETLKPPKVDSPSSKETLKPAKDQPAVSKDTLKPPKAESPSPKETTDVAEETSAEGSHDDEEVFR